MGWIGRCIASLLALASAAVSVPAAASDWICDCEEIVGSCTATVQVRNKWVRVTSTAKQCSRVDFVVNTTPFLSTFSGSFTEEEWLGGQVRAVKVDRCVVCKTRPLVAAPPAKPQAGAAPSCTDLDEQADRIFSAHSGASFWLFKAAYLKSHDCPGLAGVAEGRAAILQPASQQPDRGSIDDKHTGPNSSASFGTHSAPIGFRDNEASRSPSSATTPTDSPTSSSSGDFSFGEAAGIFGAILLGVAAGLAGVPLSPMMMAPPAAATTRPAYTAPAARSNAECTASRQQIAEYQRWLANPDSSASHSSRHAQARAAVEFGLRNELQRVQQLCR